jgi:hypothetical protein
MKTLLRVFAIIVMLFAVMFVDAKTQYLQVEHLSKEKLKLFPVPEDYRNYFFLQSVGDETCVVIGYFTGEKRIITLMKDTNADGNPDEVYDYFPDKNIYSPYKKTESALYNGNFKDMVKSIILGDCFRENYSYKMSSFYNVEKILKDNTSVVKDIDGYKATIYDPDAPMRPMSEFFFSKVRGRYDLIFKTSYYKLFNAIIHPPLDYSVFCRGSKDPIIAEHVEQLLKLAPK